MTPFPEFPLEIWLQIFDYACNDDGTSSRSLSIASRALRDVSQYHRYHSVLVSGWEQLLLFEAQFNRERDELKGIVNLYVHIPELYTVAYPAETWYIDLDAEEDPDWKEKDG